MSIRIATLFVIASGVLLAASYLYVDFRADRFASDELARYDVPAWPPKPTPTRLELGDRLPEIEVVEWLQGRPVSVDEFEGRVLLIDVWSQFCVPCHQTAPDLAALAEEFAEEDIQFVGFTVSPQQAESYLQEHQITWPNAIVSQTSLAALRRALDDDVTPDLRTSMILLVDQQGRLLWTDNADRWRHRPLGWSDRVRSAIQRALQATREDGSETVWPEDGPSSEPASTLR